MANNVKEQETYKSTMEIVPEEENKPVAEVEKTEEEKPNAFVRGWRKVKSIWKKSRKNPITRTLEDMAAGAALVEGGRIGYKLVKNHIVTDIPDLGAPIETEFVPEQEPEIDVPTDNDYVA